MTLTKQMKKDGWIDLGSDVCWEDHGGMWARKVSKEGSEYMVVRFTAEEESNIGDLGYEYETNVFLIDVDDIDQDEKAKLLSTFDLDNDPSDYELLYAKVNYWGAYHLNADVERSSTYPRRLRASAIRSANSCCGVS